MIRTWLPAAGGERRRLEEAVAPTLAGLRERDTVARIWAREDVWRRGSAAVRDRLGWLDSPEPDAAGPLTAEAVAFAAEARRDGLTDALVIGMGGSSLAPDLLGRTFAAAPDALRLRVLDSTAPDAVRRALDGPAGRTLHVVSSKSGTTTETLALFNAFFSRVAAAPGGSAAAGRFFAAITDPGTPLEALGRALRFRRIFAGPPDVGGRFSALTAFGLVPAALAGIDLEGLLAGARAVAARCRLEPPDPARWSAGLEAEDNPGAALGAILGAMAAAGRDKLLLRVPASLPGFYDWVEQLIAESTGKDGRGLLPVPLDLTDLIRHDGADRLIVIIHDEGEVLPEADIARVSDRGVPVIGLSVAGERGRAAAAALGGLFFLWEFATAVAGACLGVNPFDQPDVELTKVVTRRILADGGPAEPADGEAGGAADRGSGPGETTAGELIKFLEQGRPGDYIALQAFLDPSGEVAALVERLRQALGRRGLPATSGFGPRFLHSTGQLHKGDAGRGLFIQLTAPPGRDLPIPEAPGSPAPARSFGTLLAAQSRADRLALRERGRRVLHVDFAGPAEVGLEHLLRGLA